jgi:hypothetical protein
MEAPLYSLLAQVEIGLAVRILWITGRWPNHIAAGGLRNENLSAGTATYNFNCVIFLFKITGLTEIYSHRCFLLIMRFLKVNSSEANVWCVAAYEAYQ